MLQAECTDVLIYDWRLCGRSNDGLKWSGREKHMNAPSTVANEE